MKLRCCLIIVMMLMACFTTSHLMRFGRGIYDEKESPFDHYDEQAPLQHFEDLFFPRYFTGINEYSFDVPPFFQDKNLSWDLTWDEEYQGYQSPPDQGLEDDPVNYANITLMDQNGNILFSTDNRKINIGGGGYEGINLDDVTSMTLKTRGSFRTIFSIDLDVTHILTSSVEISFEGRGIGYCLWGMGLGDGIENYDPDKHYLVFEVRSENPLKAYVFGSPSHFRDHFEEGSYDEAGSKEKELEVRKLSIVNQPYLVLSTFGDDIEQVNATVSLEIIEQETYPNWITVVALSSVLVPVAGMMIWINKEKKKRH